MDTKTITENLFYEGKVVFIFKKQSLLHITLTE